MKAVLPHLPVLQVIIPLFGALIAVFLRRGAPAFALALAVTWIMPVIAWTMLWQVLSSGPISYAMGGWAPPWGIEYRVDILSAFVLVLVSSVGALIIPFARRSVALELDESREPWFYSMYLLCLTGLLGITVTGDAFNAFVFLEISSLSTYVLIANGRDRRALLASFQYLVMGTIGATFYVIGVGFLYLLTGSLNFVDIAHRLAEVGPDQFDAMVVALAFISVGAGLKLALFPLHAWLPNAYAYAPSFATAFLAASATKVAVYLLIRLYFSVFGQAVDYATLPIGEVVIVLSVAAMFVASAIAVFETNLKRMFAYSSVAQIGYITLGIGLANQAGLTGGLVHLFNHALMKGTIFVALGCVFFRIGSVSLGDVAGLGRRMPVTMTAFTIAGFGMIGTPGTAGFISKWYLALGALDNGSWLLVFLIVASSVISVVYVGRVIEVVWFREPTASAVIAASDPPFSMLLPLVALAASVIYFGIDTNLSAGLAGKAADMLIGGLR
jgi:multicomponent Na+:H+ antiporter subunit D